MLIFQLLFWMLDKEKHMGVKIIVDSTMDSIKEIKDRLVTVPLTIYFGDEEYTDGVTITHREFYEKLIESDVMPKTSQGSPAVFSDIYKKETKDGSELVVITLSQKLSGTYQSASIAAEDFDGKVFVVDSGNVTIGAEILAEFALELKDKGYCASEIAEKLMCEREKIRLVALVDTLEYLKYGGRISKTAAAIGGLLSIKPVLCVKDGEINVLGKARGSKQGNNLLVKEIEKAGGVDFDKPLLLGYTGLSDEILKKYIKDSAKLWEGNVTELRTTVVGSVVGTHAGPGAIAVAFFAKEE